MAQKTRQTWHGVAVTTVFSAVSLMYGTAAHGGFYPGHIDPVGTGPPNEIPGFHADFVVDIDPNCFTGSWQATNQNPVVIANNASGCGNASLYSATVDLYSTAITDPPDPGVILGHFFLGPGAYPIVGVVGDPKSLKPVEIDTDPLGPVFGTDFYSSNQFWLQFVSEVCAFGCSQFPPPSGSDPGYIYMDGLFLENLSNPGIVTFGHVCSENPAGVPVDCTIGQQQAPEPGTIGLILGALGGGWIARRRKAKVAAA